MRYGIRKANEILPLRKPVISDAKISYEIMLYRLISQEGKEHPGWTG